MKPLLPIVVLLFAWPSVAEGGLIYGFGQSNYLVGPGGQVDVDVFLQQTGTDTILTDEGLLSAGVRVFFDEPPLPGDPAEVVSVADITPNPLFDESLLEILDVTGGESAGLIDAVDFFSPPVTGDRILLGTFRFTAGNTAGEMTHLRATEFSPLFAETISGISNTTLDSQILDGTATITVAAVPEPASGVVCGMLLPAAVWFRRRAKQKHPST
ncbi:MAG: hypothetical protein MI861_25760 [Pirellulales bacterium]|nr:hypothetical protein [Pirellulales bacterium]